MYELYNGEDDLVEDLKLVRKTYADSMIHLNIIKPEVNIFLQKITIFGRFSTFYFFTIIYHFDQDEQLVFGHLNALTPLHAALHAGLKKVQCKDGFWFEIGGVVAAWIKTLEAPYVAYCANLIQVNQV